MATKYVTLKGTLKWARLYEPDEAFGAKNWKLNLYLNDDKEMEKFKATGLQLKISTDSEGSYITLRRPTQKLIKDNLVIFNPPEITGEVNVSYVDSTSKEKVRSFNKGERLITRVGDPILIGNGSEALVNICIYETRKGPGHRLENIRVLSLVPYEGSPNSEKTEEPEVETKTETKEEKKTKVDKDLNDSIPW